VSKFSKGRSGFNLSFGKAEKIRRVMASSRFVLILVE